MLKVCFVNPGATSQLFGKANNYGGAEQRSIHLAKLLKFNDVAEVSFVTSEAGITTINALPQKKKHQNSILDRFQNRLSKLIPAIPFSEQIELSEAAWKSDTFIVFGVSVMAYSILKQCKARGKKFVLAITSDDCLACEISTELLTKKNMYQCPRWIGYKLINEADQIWVQTPGQKLKLETAFQRQCVHIPNPAPFPPLLTPPGYFERKGVLWIGKADKVKDPLRAIEIAKLCPELKFTFIINNLNSQIGIDCLKHASENVTIIESVNRSEMQNFMLSHLVVFNTSIFEGMPNTFIESWAHGTPVLSTLACKELFDNDLSPGKYANDSNQKMVTLLQEFHSNETTWNLYSKRCTEYVMKNHSPETTLFHLKLAISKLCTSKS